ncbi:MAG: hypothetical protein HDR50_06755 [Desulfovibrio sp.]|uniref:hypothetical protein n=1 Tax=Desulfovibrio sp. TaxID=885 RepID=UPI001A7844AC|nr:hypothetical protein [Desulfovibrio sp.]MBD5417348.1 hypothetical protein [Desulfovibrio sp.]
MTEPDILRGWKEIERYLGMGRKAILRAGYPIRCEGGDGVTRRNIYAIRKELLDHARRGARFFIDGAA